MTAPPEPPPEPGPASPGFDPKVLVVVGIAAVVVMSPFRAGPDTDPLPVALGLAAVFTAVALGGWFVLRRAPPAE